MSTKTKSRAGKVALQHMRKGTASSTSAASMPTGCRLRTAVAGFTKDLARDLSPRGITVNNVQPGPVDTDMNPSMGAFAKSLKALMALPRYGHADEIAEFVAYLAGPEAAFITGASLSIDGGFAS